MTEIENLVEEGYKPVNQVRGTYQRINAQNLEVVCNDQPRIYFKTSLDKQPELLRVIKNYKNHSFTEALALAALPFVSITAFSAGGAILISELYERKPEIIGPILPAVMIGVLVSEVAFIKVIGSLYDKYRKSRLLNKANKLGAEVVIGKDVEKRQLA